MPEARAPSSASVRPLARDRGPARFGAAPARRGPRPGRCREGLDRGSRGRGGDPWKRVVGSRDAGGDLRIAGDAPGFDVAIEDPLVATEEAARLRIRSGALASDPPRLGPGLAPCHRSSNGSPVDRAGSAGDRVGADLRRGRGPCDLGVAYGSPGARDRPRCGRDQRRHAVHEPGDDRTGGSVTTWIIPRAAGIGPMSPCGSRWLGAWSRRRRSSPSGCRSRHPRFSTASWRARGSSCSRSTWADSCSTCTCPSSLSTSSFRCARPIGRSP